MLNSQDTLSIYQAIADNTAQMLAAARGGDWDQLTVLESICASHVRTLQTEETAVTLTDAGRNRKARLIKKILEDDREIRCITEPWMAQLSALMNNARSERKLSNAYGA